MTKVQGDGNTSEPNCVAWGPDNGVVVDSGYGDGSYPACWGIDTAAIRASWWWTSLCLTQGAMTAT